MINLSVFPLNKQRFAPVLIGPTSQSDQSQLSATICKGSDRLRALFFWRFPGEARGCAAGDVAPEMPEMAYFWPGAVSVLRLPCG